ncbi:chitin synthase [Synchytrium microbalum]|uniref:Chitin synthase n=1 Tax=Synchytrium microbalum TaxID=1806994 RepID=A0A507CIL9_9FUNG|nr:chitin synthase [Synchytrium microbalum]TPX37513.1 chitin synthase [Synchytrium microbalum]
MSGDRSRRAPQEDPFGLRSQENGEAFGPGAQQKQRKEPRNQQQQMVYSPVRVVPPITAATMMVPQNMYQPYNPYPMDQRMPQGPPPMQNVRFDTSADRQQQQHIHNSAERQQQQHSSAERRMMQDQQQRVRNQPSDPNLRQAQVVRPPHHVAMPIPLPPPVVTPRAMMNNQQYYQEQWQQPQQYQNQGQQYYPPPQQMRGNGGGHHMIPIHLPPGATIQRRAGTKKTLKLTAQGNFVQDLPVSERCLSFGRFKNSQEFSSLRYTAITCDPDEFHHQGYNLRQKEWGRKTEVFIVVTMYNEDDNLFAKTMDAVAKNVSFLCKRKNSSTWGSDAWQKVVVCIVADGRSKIHPRVLSTLGAMGCFQDGVMKESINGEPTTAHVFEYTTQIVVDSAGTFKGTEDGYCPLQVLFCLKEKNAKKINSHRWFFNAFGPIIKPEVCVLLDVGTKPTTPSIYHLWKAFDRDLNVGGACGEIYVELGAGCSNLLNPLVAAQNFEYKMSNILDKPLESVFGYISVLPGAFSAYRYVALQGEPLKKYFVGEYMHGNGSGTVFSANMYLAEDRILCFELVTKAKSAWKLKYVRSAQAETDVPSGVPEFISQRRRWLNGSFFAMLHSLSNWLALWTSKHSIIRKLGLTFLTLYNFVSVAFSWFALANFYLSFYFVFSGANSQNAYDPFFGAGYYVFETLREVYLLALMVIFVTSMGNRPQGSKVLYTMCMALFAFLFISILYVTAWVVYYAVPKSQAQWLLIGNLILNSAPLRDVVLSLASTYGMYLVASVLYMEPWHMITSFVQYMLLLPSFVNILQIYAFSNLHDVSWGTKGDSGGAALATVETKKGTNEVEVEVVTETADLEVNYEAFLLELRSAPEVQVQKVDKATAESDYFRSYRTNLLLTWIFSNFLLVILLTNPELNVFVMSKLGITQSSSFNPYLTFIFFSVAGLSAIRFTGCILYLLLSLIGC